MYFKWFQIYLIERTKRTNIYSTQEVVILSRKPETHIFVLVCWLCDLIYKILSSLTETIFSPRHGNHIFLPSNSPTISNHTPIKKKHLSSSKWDIIRSLYPPHFQLPTYQPLKNDYSFFKKPEKKQTQHMN